MTFVEKKCFFFNLQVIAYNVQRKRGGGANSQAWFTGVDAKWCFKGIREDYKRPQTNLPGRS